VVICLEQGADLHMAQLMPLLLTVSRSILPFWYRLTWVVPEKRAVKRVCVCVRLGWYSAACWAAAAAAAAAAAVLAVA